MIRLSEAQKRAVPCPQCLATAGKPCRGSRIPSPNTRSGGWGESPDLDRAHDARRKLALTTVYGSKGTQVVKKVIMSNTYGKTTLEALAKNGPNLRTVTNDKGETWSLAPRQKTGEGPCPGEAHTNPFIDNCLVCAPRWGKVDVFAPPTLEQVTKEGLAVPVNHIGMGSKRDTAFIEAEKRGDIRLVFVTENKKGSMCSYAVYVATTSWPRRCTKCGHSHAKPENAKWSVAGFFCTWCGDNAPTLKPSNETARQAASS